MRKQRSDQEKATLLDRIACGLFSALSVGLVAGLLWAFWMVFSHAPPEYFSEFVVAAVSISGIRFFSLYKYHYRNPCWYIGRIVVAVWWFQEVVMYYL